MEDMDRNLPESLRRENMKNVTLPITLTLSLILIVTGCSFKNPKGTSLDMTITIPVANEIRTMRRTVGDYPDFLTTVGTDSVLSLDIKQTIDRTVVRDELSIPAKRSEFQTEVGVFEIGSRRSDSVELSLVDIFPDAANFAGLKVPIPPVVEVGKTVDLPPFPIIRSVTVEEGQFEVRIDNSLIIPMEDVEIVLKDQSNNVEIGRLTFGRIEAGSSVTDVIDLRGKTFSNDWLIEFRVSSPGSGGESVEIDPTTVFRITTTITPLRVTAATAELPEQRFTGRGAVPLPDTILVTEAVIVAGSSFTVIVKNDLNVDAEIDVILDEMVFPSGAPVKVARAFVGAKTAKEVLIPIDEARFRPKDPRELRLSWDVATTPAIATLRSKDVIAMEIVSQRITFSRVAGRFNELSVGIPYTTQSLNVPDGLSGLSLAAASLELTIRSGLGITLRSDFEAKGTDDVGRTVVMPIKAEIEKGNPAAPVTSRVRLDEKTSKLLDLLNLLPRKLELSGRILIGDGAEESEVEQGHFIEGDARFTAPMIFSLASTSIRTDPRDVTLKDEETRSKLDRNLLSTKVITKLANHLPVGVNVRIQIARDTTRIFTNPDLTVPKEGFFTIPAGVVNPSTGLVERSTENQEEIVLAEEDFDKFLLTPLYSAILIELPQTAGTVKLLASDFVEVVSRVEATILIDEQLVKR
jgi:hypothetical protein